MSYKQGMNRNQVTLLPKTVEEYVTANNQVRFIEDLWVLVTDSVSV